MRGMCSAAARLCALLLWVVIGGLAPAGAQAQDWSGVPSAAQAMEEAQAETGHVLVFTETTQFRHTEAINQGTPLIRAALEQAGITSEHTEDSSIFNDADLARFDALVMFQASGDPWTAAEKAAMERYQRAGGGIVAIHNATDMRGNYAWWDNLIGALMPGHAATGSSPGLPAEVIVEDRTHPSTAHLDARWARADEWYNFNRNVRGDAHVLATMDETTYDPGGNRMGYDHPIAWCKPYDGGRAFVTAMGHFGAHYSEPALMQHIVGGIQWAAGLVEGDCGGTKWDQFEKVALDENTSAPFALDVAPDGRVFFTELVRGQVRVYDPATQNVKTALEIDVYAGGEDGMLGIAVDPDFEDNGYVYVYHSRDAANNGDPSSWFSQVSRWTVDENSNIDPASERLIIKVPARREDRLPNGNIDEPGHTGGGIGFDNEGNLLIGVGDDVNPHTEPSGGYAPLSERPGTFHDARATSANTNDLRGKLLRITPDRGNEGGYTIPEGNLFPESEDTADKTLPEIYAMGFRNPFRFSVDPETGWIGLADYAPDNGSNNLAQRGPAGIVEWNLIKEPGNYGWPLCIGDQQPYRDVDYTTSPVTVGEFFDCENPVNDSRLNTGLRELPPSKAPEMYYGYQTSSVPAVIPAGGGLAPMGGPFYDYDPALESDVKFPEYYDGKPFFYEWAKNRLYTMILDDAGSLEKMHRFLPTQSFLSPQDMKFGPDGALYTLEWGGGFGRDNPNSGIYRVDYINGSRSPIAQASATPDNGQEPLTVSFDSAGSSDPEGASLSYAWDFQDDGTVDSTLARGEFTYTEAGVYTARLTVTDPAGKTGTTTIPITVGNTKPRMEFGTPPNGGFFDFGDEISWDVTVTDPEEEVDYGKLIVQPALGHDEHAHPAQQFTGRTGSVVTDLGGGHSEDMKVFFALDARYTDAGDGSVPALTGSSTIVLQPKHKEAEHFDASSGGLAPQAAAGDAEGGAQALTGLGTGDWAAYRPVNLTGIDSLTFRVASTLAGGAIEVRTGAADGELLATAQVPATGGTQRWADVTVEVPESTDTTDLYLVFTGSANFRLNFWEANGKGISPVARPEVAITAPTAGDALDPGENTLTATATDAENDVAKVEFFVNGQKVGEDAEAPYTVTWNETRENYYTVHAVATNSEGLSSRSRRVQFTVGEFGVKPPWATFSSALNPPATFDQLGNTFKVSAAGSDVWQATNQYGTVYLPGGAPENFVATVKVASFDGTHNASKAGIIVRNDITAASSSPGYLVFSEKGNGEAEFMHDAAGNGQVNNAGEPVATGCPGNNVPTWLKVEKFGKTFSVYCSKNGTDWTQVGATTVIPSANAIQDIGLFVTSHIAGTLATAQFTDWSLDTDPELPEEPEEPSDPAPSCVGAYSDEFDGDLDVGRWSVVRGPHGDLPVTADGSLVMPVSNGDINEASAGPISYVGQPVPDGDWQLETKVSLAHDNAWQHAGLMQLVDDDNYVKFSLTRNTSGARFFEFQTETNGARTWHQNNVVVPANFPNTVHMRLTRTGSTLAASYSTDGTTWTTLDGTGTLKAGGTVGLVAAGDTDAANVDASFEHFRVTPDKLPEDPGVDDEFDGTSLDGCRWNRIVNYNSNRVGVADGKLSIETFDADISGRANGPIENLILQDVPEGDWTVETRMTAPLKDNWQLAGLMLYSDDDHYVKYDVVADNNPGAPRVLRTELRYENGGNLTGPGAGPDPAPPASATDTWWLRLTKSGNTYTGAISADGETWHQTPGSVTVALEDPAIGLMAIGPQQSDGPVTVDFDHFRVVEDEPVNTAPELGEVTATPESGTAPLEVQFAAAATDAEDDELDYSWDFDGDGTADSDERTPSHTYTEAGTYEAEVTVSDGELEDTATVTVTVEAPEEPGTPVVQAFADPASGPAPLRVRFSSTGLDPDGGELRYRWEFADGTVLGQRAVRTYREPGTYTATVTVTDDEGSTASDTVEVTVSEPENAAPTIEATADVTSGPAPLRVRLRSTAADDRPLSELTYEWNFGDGGTAFGRNAAHRYLEPGTYTATVTVTDAGGATATDTVEITVTDPPGNVAPTVEAAAAPATGVAPLQVRLTSHGTDPDGGALAYSWDMGDGSPVADRRNVTHTYTKAGTYTAEVTVTDAGGATASAEVEIVVQEGPGNRAPTVRAAADPRAGTSPLRVRFTSAVRDLDGDPVSLVWDFGDGAKAGGPVAVHTYTTPGVYTATVTATDPSGATGTAQVQVQVVPLQRPPAARGDVAGETVSQVTLSRSQKVRRIVRRGLRHTVTCETGCTVRSELRVTRRVARRLGLAGSARTAARLGRTGTRTIAAGRSRTIVLRLDRGDRRQLLAAMRRSGIQRIRATLITRVSSEDATRTLRRKLTLRR